MSACPSSPISVLAARARRGGARPDPVPVDLLATLTAVPVQLLGGSRPRGQGAKSEATSPPLGSLVPHQPSHTADTRLVGVRQLLLSLPGPVPCDERPYAGMSQPLGERWNLLRLVTLDGIVAGRRLVPRPVLGHA